MEMSIQLLERSRIERVMLEGLLMLENMIEGSSSKQDILSKIALLIDEVASDDLTDERPNIELPCSSSHEVPV
jgi:hypothetical protein